VRCPSGRSLEKAVFRDRGHRTPGLFWHPAHIAAEGECHENDLRGFGPGFRVHHRHGPDHDHFAGCVMKAILMFLGRGFALFAGGPAVIYQYPALSRSAVMVKIRKRGRGSLEW
jgi:hypothetical protein